MPSLPAETSINRVELTVADLDAVESFYREVIGLDVRNREADRLDLGNDTHPLVSLVESPTLDARPADAAGLFHVAVLVPSRADLAAVASRLQEVGALTGASDHGVSEALYANDPSGNGVEVYRDRPRSAWPREDGAMTMYSRPLSIDELTGELTGHDGGRRPLPPETRIGHVHLEVTDLAPSRVFYVEAVGFDTMVEWPGALFIAAGGYHHHLGLNTWHDRTQSATGLGLNLIDIALPSSASLEALRDRLDGAGYESSHGEVDEAVHVVDPDGIPLRFVPSR